MFSSASAIWAGVKSFSSMIVFTTIWKCPATPSFSIRSVRSGWVGASRSGSSANSGSPIAQRSSRFSDTAVLPLPPRDVIAVMAPRATRPGSTSIGGVMIVSRRYSPRERTGIGSSTASAGRLAVTN